MNKSTVLVLLTSLCISAPTFAQAATPAPAAVSADYVSLDDFPGTASAATGVYKLEADSSMKETLAQWSEQAGWQRPEIRLPDDTDFVFGSSHEFKGDFPSVVAQLRLALGSEASTLKFKISRGSKVLTVSEGDL